MTALIILAATALTLLLCGSVIALGGIEARPRPARFSPGTGRHRRPGPARILPDFGSRS
jgi:hypothetical protein